VGGAGSKAGEEEVESIGTYRLRMGMLPTAHNGLGVSHSTVRPPWKEN